MRFPVVLFDLDGTLIDSTPIILASLQHATQNRARGGGSRRGDLCDRRWADARGADAVVLVRSTFEELVAVYRAHNDAAARRARALCRDGRRACHAEGRGPPARDRHLEAAAYGRARVRPARDRALLRHDRRRRRDGEPQAEPGAGCCSRSTRSVRRPATPSTSATPPTTSARPARRACSPIGVSWGGMHERHATPTRLSSTDGGAPCRPLRRGASRRAARASAHAGATSTTRSTSRASTTRPTTAPTTSSSALEAAHPELVTPDSPTQRVGARALGAVPEGDAPRADGLAREGHDRGRGSRSGRRRPPAPRLRRAGRLRDRAEDRRARDQPHLRGRRASSAARRAATGSRART